MRFASAAVWPFLELTMGTVISEERLDYLMTNHSYRRSRFHARFSGEIRFDSPELHTLACPLNKHEKKTKMHRNTSNQLNKLLFSSFLARLFSFTVYHKPQYVILVNNSISRKQ